MKLEDQVVSLDLAKRLKALGVKQESAFYFETIVNEEGDRTVTNLRFGKFYDDSANKKHVSYIAALTVAELLSKLPTNKVRLVKWFDEYYCEAFGDVANETDPIGRRTDKNPANSCAKMLIYLIEQGIVKP